MSLNTVFNAMSDMTNRLRLLAGYHIGVDLVERLAYAERHQQMQREALHKAADRIDELELEVATLKAESQPPDTPTG